MFEAPWQATVFAIAVQLSKNGHFTWKEWVDTLAAEIAQVEGHEQFDHDHDERGGYYITWMITLEKLLSNKNILPGKDVERRFEHLVANPLPHDHVARRTPVCIA